MIAKIFKLKANPASQSCFEFNQKNISSIALTAQ